jgi:integrase
MAVRGALRKPNRLASSGVRQSGQSILQPSHAIQGDELRALRRLHRESPTSPFVFVSERGSPFTTAGFARMIERAAAGADLEIKAHPHMLRHARGYALANKGHDTRAIQGWLGHRLKGGPPIGGWGLGGVRDRRASGLRSGG